MKNFFQKRSNGQKGAGFSLVDLMVASTIIIIIFSFVLASFRTGQYSGEIDVVLKQVTDGVTTARTLTLGGKQLPDGTFPPGGYGINFDAENPSQFVLFELPTLGGSYKSGDGQAISGGIKQFNNIRFVQFCGANDVSTLPCEPGAWQNLQVGSSDYLEIIFPSPGETLVNYPASGGFNYVGGIIEHQKTGQRAYFYVSRLSGLVTGDLFYD